MAYKKEEMLSKNTCCYRHKDQQRNTCFLEVTDENMHDGRKVMPRLIEHILKRKDNKDVKIESALGDGSYDSNENFK